MVSGIISRRKLNKGWAILSLLLVAALLLNGCAETRAARVYHVGILSGLDFLADAVDGFKATMAELGYVEGENIIYDVQKTNFDIAAYDSILQKFIDDAVDLILVFPTEASQEAKRLTEGTDIPVVFTYAVVDGMGLVDDLRNPGGNLTGVRYPGTEIALLRLQTMLELVPQAKRILVPFQRGYPTIPPQLEALRPAANTAGITLIEAPADNAAQLQSILDSQVSGDIDAILLLVEPLAVSSDAYRVLSSYAYEHNLPIGGVYVATGDLHTIFGIGVNSYDAGTLAAPLANKILQGTPAGSIPITSSESYFEIDVRVAQHFGIAAPVSLLQQANMIVR